MKAELNQRARNLRQKLTPAEKSLWSHLRARKLNGYKFNRQFVIEPYIVDFICREHKLIVELDGMHHKSPDIIEYDEERTHFLNAKEYHVLRFTNEQVLRRTDKVLSCILSFLPSPYRATHAPSPAEAVEG